MRERKRIGILRLFFTCFDFPEKTNLEGLRVCVSILEVRVPSSNIVGIICPPGLDRLNWSAKILGCQAVRPKKIRGYQTPLAPVLIQALKVFTSKVFWDKITLKTVEIFFSKTCQKNFKKIWFLRKDLKFKSWNAIFVLSHLGFPEKIYFWKLIYMTICWMPIL